MSGVTTATPSASGRAGPSDASADDLAPPGERYFRHPGDVVRLAVWAGVTVLLAVVIAIGTATSDGVTTDLARLGGRLATSIRELILALTQVLAVVIPAGVVIGLAVRQRWRRLLLLVLAGAGGAALWAVLDSVLDLPGRLPDAVNSGTWVASTRFPSPGFLAGAAAAVMVGKPWLGRSWRRAVDITLVVLVAVMVVCGTAGLPALLVAVAGGMAVGAAVLVAFGAPNRRPSPAMVAASLRACGLAVEGLDLQRAQGGRAQLYVAALTGGGRAFVKVYGRDSRDADLLYRSYRGLVLRGPNDGWPTSSLKHGVEHEALLLQLAGNGGVRCPRVEALTELSEGSIALALGYVAGVELDEVSPEDLDDRLLDATWQEVRVLHDRHLAHRALRAGNVLVGAQGPVLIDFGFGDSSATARLQAIDCAELLASLASLVGAARAVASASRTLGNERLAAAVPYLQPLGLSAATRKQTSKGVLADLRSEIAAVTGEEPAPLEQLIRVHPRTLLMIAAAVAAFYVLLPQLANVGDSFRAIRDANWGWLAVAFVMSLLTYVASAVGLAGGVPERLPAGPNVTAQFASTFVNRVTPANVGGMALNVRFLQKAGVPSPEAITGVGLNSLAGAIVHMILLVVFFAWAGQSGGGGFSIPSGSKLLVAIAVALAVAGIAMATSRGRLLVRTHVVSFVKRSWASLAKLARSPVKLTALFGGSAGVTLAYIGAFGASVAAFQGGVTIGQVGAVYLGASLIAAAAPTPGGLGALEAALVAGLTGVGMESGAAVAAVLSYRLITYWLPILPGWICFRALDRRGLI